MSGQAGQVRGRPWGRQNVDGFMALTCTYGLRGKWGKQKWPIEAGRVSSSEKRGREKLSLWEPLDLRPKWRICLPRLPQTISTGRLTCENRGAGATCPYLPRTCPSGAPVDLAVRDHK